MDYNHLHMEILPTTLDTNYQVLRRSSYFASLPQPALDQLAQEMSFRRYGAGEVISWQGDFCQGLWMIHAGRVKLFKLSPRGRELILNTLGSGAVFNEVPVFDGGTNPVNVAALGEVEIWLVDQKVILRVMLTYPELCQSVVANLAANLRLLVNKVEELSFFQVPNRLARLLIQLPANPEQPEWLEGITQDQLAARLGTVREVVSRALRDLELSGAIRVKRRQIHIVDKTLLSAWAQEARQ